MRKLVHFDCRRFALICEGLIGIPNFLDIHKGQQ